MEKDRKKEDYEVEADQLGLLKKRRCFCNWQDDCLALSVQYTRLQDPEYAGDSLYLQVWPNVSEKTSKQYQWREGIRVNTGAEVIPQSKDPSEKQRVYLAKHHFSRAQIKYSNEKGKRLSTPLDIATLKQIAYNVDKCFNIKQKNTKKYFNLPNHPKAAVAFDLKAAREGRLRVRDQQRERQLLEAEQKEHRKLQQLDFETWSARKREQERERNERDAEHAELKRRVRELEQTVEVQKTAIEINQRAKRQRNLATVMPPPKGLDESTIAKLEESLAGLFQIVGGLTRTNLLSSSWHDKNNGAANTLFGFENLDQMIVYIKAFFPFIDTTEATKFEVRRDATMKVVPTALSQLEQCLACKMFMHSLPHRAIVARVYGVQPAWMGKIVSRWAPKWGQVGEFVSILPMPDFYFDKELPDEYNLRHLERIAALLDGKDFLLHVKRTDDFLRRTQNSSKMKAAAARGIAWTTPAGLTFEHTKMYGGRVTEQRLVQLWGSLGIAKAPLNEWQGWAAMEENKEKISTEGLGTLGLRLSTDDVDVNVDVRNDGPNKNTPNDDVPDDDATGYDDKIYADNDAPLGDSILGEMEVASSEDEDCDSNLDKDSDSHSEFNSVEIELGAMPENCNDVEEAQDKGRYKYIDLLKMGLDEHNLRKAALKKKESYIDVEEKRQKLFILEDADEIRKEAEAGLKSSPQHDPLLFVCQLELHERLHRLYEAGTLSKTILAFYLKTVERYRLDLLHWLGSSVVEIDYSPTYTDKPADVMLRLAKIPKGKENLGDKGFHRTDRFYPFLNKTQCPKLLLSRKVKQYLASEITAPGDGKKDICRLRYTAEVCFSRMTDMTGLQDVIPYQNIGILPYMYEVGFMMMNLQRTPLRLPGKGSDIDVTYFDKATNK